MRRAAKVDRNQPAIVEAFREMGCQVQPLHTVGGGCPDILCAIAGFNVPVEIKDGSGGFTPDQKKWHAEWGAPVHVVRDVLDVAMVVQHYQGKAKR